MMMIVKMMILVVMMMMTNTIVPQMTNKIKYDYDHYDNDNDDYYNTDSNVSRAYNIQYDGSTTEFNVSSSAVRCLPVGNVLRMSNCVIINIYVARRKQCYRLLLSH